MLNLWIYYTVFTNYSKKNVLCSEDWFIINLTTRMLKWAVFTLISMNNFTVAFKYFNNLKAIDFLNINIY